MNGVKTLARLSQYPFEDHTHQSSWSWPGYTDVTILSHATRPGGKVEVRFAMWGLYNGVKHMAERIFTSVKIHLAWRSEVVGYIYISGTRSHLPGIVGSISTASRIRRYNTLGPSSL